MLHLRPVVLSQPLLKRWIIPIDWFMPVSLIATTGLLPNSQLNCHCLLPWMIVTFVSRPSFLTSNTPPLVPKSFTCCLTCFSTCLSISGCPSNWYLFHAFRRDCSQIKVVAILRTGTLLNIFFRLDCKIKMSLNLDYVVIYGTLGTASTQLIGAYSALSLMNLENS